MRTLLTFFLVGCFVSCGPSKTDYDKLLNEKDALVKENAILKDSVSSLKQDIEGYKNTPDKLLFAANERVINSDRHGLRAILDQLHKYHPSSSEYQKVGDMLSKMDKDIADKMQREKDLRMKAVAKLKKKYDDVSNITWYYNPYFTHYTNSNLTSIYIGQKIGTTWLRLVMSYYGEDWIFFENAYLSFDGNTREIVFDKHEDKETENDSSVWEWIDIKVDDSLLEYLKQMADGKDIKMRLSGKYAKTRNLSAKEINGIKDVLLAYDVLINDSIIDE